MLFSLRGLIWLKNAVYFFMVRIYVAYIRAASRGHFTCDSLQHYILYMYIVHKASLGDLPERDEIPTLILFVI